MYQKLTLFRVLNPFFFFSWQCILTISLDFFCETLLKISKKGLNSFLKYTFCSHFRHSGQRDYKCAACGFFGYTYTDIRKHIERRHSVSCPECRLVFTDVELLKVSVWPL